MEQSLKKRKRLEKSLFDEKEHYKMYKSGGRWVSAKISTAVAGVALFSTMILGGANANADSVNNVDTTATPKTEQTVLATTVAKPATETANSSTISTDTNSVENNAITNKSTETAKATTNNDVAKENTQTTPTTVNNGVNKENVQSTQPVANNQTTSDVAKNNTVPTKETQNSNVSNNNTNSQMTPANVSTNGTQETKESNSANSNGGNSTAKQEQGNNAGIAVDVPHKDLDDAIDKAHQAGVNVVQDANKHESTTADKVQDAENNISNDYKNQASAIEEATKKYQDALNKYNEEMKKYDNNGLAMDGVDSSTIKQNLQLNKSPNAEISYDKLTNNADFKDITIDSNEPNGIDSKKGIIIIAKDQNGINGDIAKVTFTNVNGSYKGIKIGKIVATFSDLKNGDGIINKVGDYDSNKKPFLKIYSDPTDGFWYTNSNGVTVTYQYYDENGNLITLDPNDSYMTVSSLNNSNESNDNKEHLEQATLDSDGKAISLKGSSVSAHGNTLYSDKNNDANQKEWDVTGSDKAYYGSGVFALSGNSVKISFLTKNQDAHNPYTWVQMSTTIPQTPVKPQAPTVHYQLTDLTVTPQPSKDVQAGTTDGTGASINGKDVVEGQDITWHLSTSNLPANRKDNIPSYVITDKLDENFKYDSFKAKLGDKDVTNMFVPKLEKGSDGKWTLTLTANQELLDMMNKDKSAEFVMPSIDIYGTAIKGGQDLNNNYTETIGNQSWNSNTATVIPEKPGTPVKDVVNSDGENINDTNVSRGDSLIYDGYLDLTNTSKDVVLTEDTIKKGLGITDTLPKGVTLDKNKVRVNAADGKDITDQFTITYENGTLKVMAKDPAALVKAYGGTKIKVTMPTTVNDNFEGDISNTLFQNTFGQTTASNTVVNHVPPMNPTKDAVVNVGSKDSLNGKEIGLNETFDYKLNSSTRPENYGGKTTEWGGTDYLDTEHDEFTGQWKVYNNYDFVLKDGTVVKAGTDISKYFTMTYNSETGRFDVEANKDFLDIMNLPANKKTKQQWSVYIQCKRIKAGTVNNTWVEHYNNRDVKSNKVTTKTPEPKKETPKTPEKKETSKENTPTPEKTNVVKTATPKAPEVVSKPTPEKATPQATPVTPVMAAATPVEQQKEETMPQTGETENNEAALLGLALLGAVGTMVIGKKKRYGSDK